VDLPVVELSVVNFAGLRWLGRFKAGGSPS